MDPFLAKMYGTAEAIGAEPSSSDMDKLAQAKMLDEMISAETGYQFDEVPNEVILKVASQVFGDDSLLKTAEDVEETKQATKEPEAQPEQTKVAEQEKTAEEEAQEKLAEADFLGRLMAHAYVSELHNIEKQAQEGESAEEEEKEEKEEAKEEKKPLPPFMKKEEKEEEAEKKAAFEAMAVERARAMLKEAGYPVEEEPTEQEVLKQAVDQRALELLKEAGYPVE